MSAGFHKIHSSISDPTEPNGRGRTQVAKRIVQLRGIFTDAVIQTHGPPDALALTRIESAAVSLAVAEAARARFLTGMLSPDDLVRLENRAARAERALGLGQAKPKPAPTLAAHLASADRNLG